MICKEAKKWDMIKDLGLENKSDAVFEDGPKNIPSLTKRGYNIYYPTWHGYLKGCKYGKSFDSWESLFQMMKKLWIKKNLKILGY